MSTFTLAKTRALVPVDVGIVASALVLGCGSGSGPIGPSGGEQTGSAKAAITSQGITVDGCRAHGVFDVTSPTAIGFVAMDSPDLQNAQMQLFQVDGANRTTQVQATAHQANPSTQALLDGAAEQASQNAALRELQSSASSTSTQSSGGTRSDSQSADSSHQAMATSERGMSSFASSSQGGSSANVAGASATNHAANAQASSSRSSVTTLVFDRLSQLDSNHMMLVVDATAHQASSLLRLFQGTNGVVTDVQTFPITAATCSGVSASVPIVTPVARPPG